MTALQPIVYCPEYPDPSFLIFSEAVPPLVYYSHLPVAIIALLFGLVIFLNAPKNLAAKLLFSMIVAFVTWVVADSIFWASNRADIILIVWSLQILVEPVVLALGLYLVYVMVFGKDMPFKWKILIAALYLPVPLLLPTDHSLYNFDTGECLPDQGIMAQYYTYIIEAIYLAIAGGITVYGLIKAKSKSARTKIIMATVGILLFLFTFLGGSFLGSFTDDWTIGQWGLFGTPLLLIFLSYSIVRFRTFNLRMIGAQALVFAVVAMIGAQFFFPTTPVNRILIAFTFLTVVMFGGFLIRSVQKEIKQREELQKLTLKLESTNKHLQELDALKSEFLSIATHQIRTPLTGIGWQISMLLDRSLGPVAAAQKEALEMVSTSIQSLTRVVNDFLDISRIEQGRMVFKFESTDIGQLTERAFRELKPNITQKGLKSKLTIQEGVDLTALADETKLKQVILNVIDNSVKYTPKGSIDIKLARDNKKNLLRFTVTDTGVGVDATELPKLFKKFSRAKDAQKTSSTGTGLGMYVAKNIIQAHRGTIWAESKGKGKGTTMIFEIPATDSAKVSNKPKAKKTQTTK